MHHQKAWRTGELDSQGQLFPCLLRVRYVVCPAYVVSERATGCATGTALYLCFSAGDVSYSVTVDGAVAEASAFTPAAGTACQASGAETMFGASALTLDTHDVTLSVTGTPANDFRFFGGGFTMGVNTNGCATLAFVARD